MILIVDPDAQTKKALLKENAPVQNVPTMHVTEELEFWRVLNAVKPDLILLELMLLKLDSLQLLQKLKASPKTAEIPVILLSQENDMNQRIRGLRLGAEDCLIKPFSEQELQLRVFAALRRRSTPVVTEKVGRELELGPFRLNQQLLRFYVDDEEIDLTTTEFRLMLALMKRMGELCKRKDLLKEVWSISSGNSRTLDTHMRRIRKKLGSYAGLLQTVHGKGYVLDISMQVS